MNKVNLKKGSGIVEIIIAISIFTVILGTLITASNLYLSGAAENLKSTKGAYLAEEGIEAIKIIRDSNWSNISALNDNVNYYLYFDTSSSTSNIWKATTTTSNIDLFVRTFKLNPVYRDANGRIISNGGALDQNTKKVTVDISWKTKNATTTKNLSTYITNII